MNDLTIFIQELQVRATQSDAKHGAIMYPEKAASFAANLKWEIDKLEVMKQALNQTFIHN